MRVFRRHHENGLLEPTVGSGDQAQEPVNLRDRAADEAELGSSEGAASRCFVPALAAAVFVRLAGAVGSGGSFEPLLLIRVNLKNGTLCSGKQSHRIW